MGEEEGRSERSAVPGKKKARVDIDGEVVNGEEESTQQKLTKVTGEAGRGDKGPLGRQRLEKRKRWNTALLRPEVLTDV